MKPAILILTASLLLIAVSRGVNAAEQGDGTINGVVLMQGKPAAQAKVELFKSDGPLSRNDRIMGKKEHFMSVSTAITDDDGNFTFPFNSKATYRITATKKGAGHGGTTVTAAKGETVKVSIELKGGKPTTSGDDQN